VTKAELKKLMAKYSYEYDNDGQIVIYTGWYETNDRQLTTEPQYDDGEDE
jgi:hypothetical protein